MNPYFYSVDGLSRTNYDKLLDVILLLTIVILVSTAVNIVFNNLKGGKE